MGCISTSCSRLEFRFSSLARCTPQPSLIYNRSLSSHLRTAPKPSGHCNFLFCLIRGCCPCVCFLDRCFHRPFGLCGLSLVDGLASLLTTRILDLEFFRGSLIADLCSCQPVTVDRREMTKKIANCQETNITNAGYSYDRN